MNIQQFLAGILNPNPGNRLANPGNGGNYLAQTGLGPEQLARYHQMSGMGAAPQGAPPASVSAPQAPMPAQPQTASTASPVASGGGLLSGLAGLFGGGRNAQVENETAQWLVQKGYDPGTARALAGNKEVMQRILLSQVGDNEGTEFDQRARAAQQYGLDPASPEGQAFILSGDLPEARGGAAELGLNPQYGVDDQGNPVLIQIGKDGKAVQTALPEGIKLSKEPIKLDAGTHWVLLDPISRQPVGQIPKELGEAEADKAAGKARGEARFDLPRAELNAQQTIEIIQKLINHPGRAGSTGFLQGKFPAYSQETQDFQNELKKAKGRTFLEAYSILKGGGQITEIEGAKAEQAIANLERSTSDEEFRQNLMLLEEAVRDGLEKLRRQAGVSSAPAPELPLPSSDRFRNDPDASKSARPGSNVDLTNMPPPEGIEPNVWKHMPLEKRKLWLP